MWEDLFILKRCLLKCLGRGLQAHKLLFSSPADTYIHVGVVNSTEIFPIKKECLLETLYFAFLRPNLQLCCSLDSSKCLLGDESFCYQLDYFLLVDGGKPGTE